jgi:hypothetical protein
MKKFNVIESSDNRGISEVNRVWNIEGKSGKEVFKLIIEKEIKESKENGGGWIEYVNSMGISNSSSWVKKKSEWRDVFFVEGDIEGSEFNIDMCDELRSFMIIREDSKYYNKFKCDVSDFDEENVNLFYEILESIL